MKILFCVNSLGGFGGIERVTIVKANALAAIEGNEVGICYTDKGAYPETIHPLSLSVKVFGLNTPYWGFTSLSTIAKGFIPMVYRTRKALLKLIKSFRPDVIITTGSYEKFALASIGLTRAMVRSSSATVGNTLIIREYHFNSNYRQYLGGSKINKLAGKAAEWFERSLLSRCFDKSFLLTKSDLNAHFKGKKKFSYMYNPSSFCPVEVAAYIDRPKVVLAVGRMVAQKNFEALIDIWSKAYSKAPGWKLRIIGDGSDMGVLKQLVKKRGLEDFVELPGKSSHVEKEMDSAQIYAMTSRYEGFPLVLLEAQSIGLPIVSFDTPYGPSEIVRHNKDGYIVGYNDCEAFANKLLEMIHNDTLRQQMSDNALKRSKEFTPEVIADKWMDIYNGLLKEKYSK